MLFFSVIRGVGEIDLLSGEPIHQRSETPYLEKPYEDCPYLLLDVRDNDEYQLCHITGGKDGFKHDFLKILKHFLKDTTFHVSK